MARGRKPKANRDEVATTQVSLRLTSEDRAALLAMVARRSAKTGSPYTLASLIRALLREALAADCSTTRSKPSGRRRAKKAPLRPPTVDEYLASKRRDELVSVPDLVRVVCGKTSPDRSSVLQVHRVLLDGCSSCRWELRPESGIELLSGKDAALCPLGIKNSVLSYLRKL